MPLPPSASFDQDMYIVGDVVNETGKVTIKNFEGSITVSGEIRGNPIEIYAAKDFTLNSDDWFHTGKDPRQIWTSTRCGAPSTPPTAPTTSTRMPMPPA